MPMIEIADRDFVRLQKVAVPFIDTPATALTKVLDALERLSVENGDTRTEPVVSTMATYHHDNLPPLIHTKLLDAEFGGKQPDKMTWDALVRLALVEAKSKTGTVQGVQKISAANLFGGRKEDEGYKYLADHGFSYQGVSAEDAVKIVFRCAKAMGLDFSAEFEWRSKEDAFRPGERARLEFRAP
jgi:hypothetical protein